MNFNIKHFQRIYLESKKKYFIFGKNKLELSKEKHVY